MNKKLLCLLLSLLSVHAFAADELRTLRAKAIREAAQRIAPSLVRVEKFGVAEAEGEVADDAPTVAIAIDDKRHFIASTLVQRQMPTAIVLVAEDGRRSTAKIIATDFKRQYVLLEAAEDLGIKPIELDITQSTVGQTVVAVGRIAGDGSLAISSGILSAKDRLWGIALQTDARISSVFYGGALVDLHGRLLGVIVPVVPDDMGEDATAWYDAGVAFAIPADSIGERLTTLIAGNDVHAGLLGIVAKSNDPYVESTAIAAVRPRSPAARADIQAGDVLNSIAGIPVRSHREIKQILGSRDAGQDVVIELKRKDQSLTKTATLAESIPPLQPQWIGITAIEQNPANDPNTKQVVVTGLFAESPASESMKVNDIIQSINGSPVADIDALRRVVFAADPDKPLQLAIVREGEDKPVAISIKTSNQSSKVVESLPESLLYRDDKAVKWSVTDLTMPDLGNKSAIVAPEVSEQTPLPNDDLGLLLLLADPGESDLQKIASSWLDVARKAGVIVCITAPAQDDRWQPDEIDSAGRIVSSIDKRYPVNSLMTVVGGASSGQVAGAGGSMAMAVAIGRPGQFTGLAVSPKVTPPAIRLRENDAAAPLQIFLRGTSAPDEPTWPAVLEKNGYAIVRGDDKNEILLRWVRSLPRI